MNGAAPAPCVGGGATGIERMLGFFGLAFAVVVGAIAIDLLTGGKLAERIGLGALVPAADDEQG